MSERVNIEQVREALGASHGLAFFDDQLKLRKIIRQMADEIEALRAENAELHCREEYSRIVGEKLLERMNLSPDEQLKLMNDIHAEMEAERRESQTNFALHNMYFPSRPNSGLYGKYIVSKSDGSEVDSRAEYFVLRIDSYQSDREHTYACRTALMAFAFATCNPDLARDVVLWNQKWDEYDKEHGVEDIEDKRLPFSADDLVDFYEGYYLPKVKEIEAENGLFQKTSSDELNGLAMESAFSDWKNAMLSVVMGDPNSEIPEL